jgi:hypothetical protein
LLTKDPSKITFETHIPKANNISEDRVFKRAICQKSKSEPLAFKTYEEGSGVAAFKKEPKPPSKPKCEEKEKSAVSSDWDDEEEAHKKAPGKNQSRCAVVYDDMDLFE